MKAKLIIENITESINFTITSDNGLLSFNRGQQSKTNNVRPNYCVTAGYGNARFYDNDNNIERYANLGYLKDNKKVKLYLNDDLIGVYETSSFSKDGKIVTLEFQDILLRAKNIQIPFTLKEDYISDGYTNIGYYVRALLVSNGFEVSSNFITTINSILNDLEEGDFILGCSLWELLDKLCKSFKICVFTNDKGKVDIDYQLSPKTLKIRNFDYYSQPKLNPFNNNQVNNVSIDRYWKTNNEELFNSKNIWNGINKNYGIKFYLFYAPTISYYGQSFLYANEVENESYIKANEVAYKTYEWNGGSETYPYRMKTNLMYLSFKIPINKDYGQNNFSGYKEFSNSRISLTCQAKEFINNNGNTANNITANYEINLQESSTGLVVLEDYRMFEELFDELIGLDFTMQNENPINFTSYWYVRGGEYIELYLLVPNNLYQYYKYVISNGTAYYEREIVYENFTLTINGVKTYKLESSSTQLFTNKDVDLKLNGNELVTINNAQKIIEKVYDEWQDGKKTLNLTCYKGNYYDINGNLVYNESSGETIKVGDIVIPYINSNGIERPIGNIDDTTPVQYEVTSSEIQYGGNIKLNLELLEK